MEYIIRYTAAFILVLVTHTSFAAKIAVVEPLEAIANSDQGQAEQDKMKAVLSKEESKGIAMQQELKSLMERYQKDSAVMSAESVRDLENNIEEKQMDIKFLSQKLQKRVQDSSKEIINRLRPGFQQALKNVVESEKFDIIIQRQVVLDLGTSIDITTMVTEEMNKKAESAK
ncbi:MAG: OmpH family outer membrane protein [Pseudomonadales bacterium]|nr:OmpH family outer membrane protein [Pseudomonadales bacterium]